MPITVSAEDGWVVVDQGGRADAVCLSPLAAEKLAESLSQKAQEVGPSPLILVAGSVIDPTKHAGYQVGLVPNTPVGPMVGIRWNNPELGFLSTIKLLRDDAIDLAGRIRHVLGQMNKYWQEWHAHRMERQQQRKNILRSGR